MIIIEDSSFDVNSNNVYLNDDSKCNINSNNKYMTQHQKYKKELVLMKRK
jgi:hypothetical protein